MRRTDTRTNFVILFQGRTGSSFLVDALHRHPDIFASGEILADLDTVASSSRTLVSRIRERVCRFHNGCARDQQLDIVRHFYDDTRTYRRVVGFKTKVRDIFDLRGFKSVLDDREVRAIIMERSNLVKQTISRLNARRLHEATNAWNLQLDARRPPPFAVDTVEFGRVLEGVISDQRILRAFADYLNVPKMRLEYSDLLRDREAWFDAVFSFLEVEPYDLDSAVLKNTDDNLKNVVINLEELKENYRGTKFEPMFES